MNRKQADEVVMYVGRLWDGMPLNVDQAEVWSDVFALDWLTVDEAKRIAREVRTASPYQRPMPVEFVKAIAEEDRKRLRAIHADKIKAAATTDNLTGRKTITEWKQFYMTDPAGRAEWAVLSGATRRGLRMLFGIVDAEAKGNRKRVGA